VFTQFSDSLIKFVFVFLDILVKNPSLRVET